MMNERDCQVCRINWIALARRKPRRKRLGTLGSLYFISTILLKVIIKLKPQLVKTSEGANPCSTQRIAAPKPCQHGIVDRGKIVHQWKAPVQGR
jgi:hypothetical protein